MDDILLVLLAAALGAAIGKFTEMFVEDYKKRRTERNTLAFARIDEVLAWGWSGETLLRWLIDLDRQLIRGDMSDALEGTAPQWAPVFMAHPETWVLLVKGPKRIVGYWHFVALRDEPFMRAKACGLLDGEITAETVESIDVPGTYNLYFTLLGVLPEHPMGRGKLIQSFLESLEALAERGVFFREMCTNAMTTESQTLCDNFGMAHIGSHRVEGKVYSLRFDAWPERLRHRRWHNLQELYAYGLAIE